MTKFQGLFESAFSGDIVGDNEIDTTIDKFTHLQRICASAITALGAASNAWLQMIAAGVVLNSNDLGMSASEKNIIRQSILSQLLGFKQSCKGLLRISTKSFKILCEKLQETGRLRSYDHESADEQVATFLFIIGQKFSNSVVSFMLSRSGGHAVVISTTYFMPNRFSSRILKQPNKNEISPVISQSSKFYPFFKDCLGALEGTHVRVKVPILDAPSYRGRKDWPTQNVLACCTFDMRFIYIWAGWEGSASDSKVLKSALTRDNPLKIPTRKYYLCDAVFGLSNKILVPYGKTRYHLKDYAIRGPQNYQELFNLRHVNLRNCIERCFRILKKRSPILSTGAECQYSYNTMTNIILACCVLHNFLIDYESDYMLREVGDPSLDSYNEHPTAEGGITSQSKLMDNNKGHDLREHIAMEMYTN